jgi:hypothetical protein
LRPFVAVDEEQYVRSPPSNRSIDSTVKWAAQLFTELDGSPRPDPKTLAISVVDFGPRAGAGVAPSRQASETESVLPVGKFVHSEGSG